MKLLDIFTPETPARISLVGGGGKTTLAFALAREYAASRGRVMVTTTTAMFHPDQPARTAQPQYCHDIFHLGPKQALPIVRPGQIILAALSRSGPKIMGYPPGDLAGYVGPFDALITEADGARMKPVKAPASHEPVLPPGTKTLIACIGLDCLDKPLNERRVHRPELLAQITGAVQEEPLTAEHLVRLAAHPEGCFKGALPHTQKVLVLNKADTPALVQRGRDLMVRMKEDVPELSACLVTCLSDREDPVKAWESL